MTTTGKSLPEELTIDILSRLTVKQLMRFSYITSDLLKETLVSFFIVIKKVRASGVKFQYAEDYTECDKPVILKLPFTTSLTHRHQYNISGICNGLLLLTREYNSKLRHSADSFCVYIWNPLTVGYTSLPSLKIPSLKSRHVSCMTSFGLGFDQATNDYKVVSLSVIWKFPGYDYATQVSVYSLCKASWRSLEDDIPYRISYNGKNSRTMVNGAFHWLAHKLDRFDTILSFDINTETIREMPFPVSNGEHHMWLRELGGLLASFQLGSDGELNLWVMKEYGVYDSWTKHVTIGNSEVRISLWPVDVVNNGDIIFKERSSTRTKLILYDPKTNVIKELKNVPNKWIDYAISAYRESLVSPKNLPNY